jgi:hypothetical protein
MPEGDPQAVGHKAKLGAYCVLKMNKPVLDLIEHTWLEDESSIPGGGDEFNVRRRIINPIYASLTAPERTSADASERLALSEQVIRDSYYGFNTCVIRVTGISPKSSFRMKLYQGFELSCTAQSTGRFYTHPSPDEDEAALKIAHNILSKMPSAFPSDYNAFGWLRKLWSGIKKPIASILPIIGSTAGNIVAPGLGGAVGGKIGNMVGGWMS